MSEKPHLREVLDPDTGEVVECSACRIRDDEIKGLRRDVRAWQIRYAELARDKEREAQLSDLWPEVERVVDYWRKKCKHPRARMSVDRFWIIEPFLSKDGYDLCIRAIDGAAFDPFITTRKNGTKKRHDGLELIFRDRGKFEEFCNRAPLK